MTGIERPGGGPSGDVQFDAEWVMLMLKAKEAGLTVAEIREFLRTAAGKETDKDNILLTGTTD